ncbi:hypothetical protein K439DRAFT_1613287 [Ramaria rubella]|nr:hypothetical protein K439DRAFT_1613287 [Ramaria rubella]
MEMDGVMSMDNISAADPQETVPSSFSNIVPMPCSDSYIEYLSTLLGHTEPLVHFQLPPEDTLISIYNRLGISMPDVDLSNYKGLPDNDLSWERMQIYLALDRGEIEDMYHIPVQDFVFRLLGGNCPVSLFWDLSSSHPFPLNPNHRMFRVAIWRVCGKEKPLYALHPLAPIPEGCEWILLVNDAATIFETLRREFSSRDAVARYYMLLY